MSDDDETIDGLTKLRIAGYAAPRLRAAKSRRVKVTNAAGEIVREMELAEIGQKLVERIGIEFDVQPGVKAERKVCACGKTFKPTGRSATAATRNMCRRCIGAVCVKCGKTVSVQRAAHARAKKYRPYCAECSQRRKATPLPCAVCGDDVDAAKAGAAKRLGRPIRCGRHPLRPLLAKIACSVCGAEASANSAQHHRSKGTAAYCAIHSPSRPRELLRCAVCGESATPLSSKNAYAGRANHAYCSEHRRGRLIAPDKPSQTS